MDSEAAQFAWQQQNTLGIPTIPDVAHVCKSMRNNIVNHHVFIQEQLVNTRQLLWLAKEEGFLINPSACILSDKTSHRQLETLLLATIPSLATASQLNPDPINFRGAPVSHFANITSVRAGMGQDVVIDSGKVHIVRRSGKKDRYRQVDLADDAICAIPVNDVSSCLLLCRHNVVELLDMERGTTRHIRVVFQQPSMTSVSMLCFDKAGQQHGFALGNNCVSTCSFDGRKVIIRNSVSVTLPPIVNDIACHGGALYTGTTQGLIKCQGEETHCLLDHPAWSVAATDSGVTAAASDGVYEVIAAPPAVSRLVRLELIFPAPVAMCQRSVLLGTHGCVRLISHTKPLIRYIRTVCSP